MYQRFDGMLPLFLFIFTLIEQTYNICIYTTRRVYTTLVILIASSGGAEPRFELVPAVQQAEPTLYYLSHAALCLSHAAPCLSHAAP
jgi:hypothetical protein